MLQYVRIAAKVDPSFVKSNYNYTRTSPALAQGWMATLVAFHEDRTRENKLQPGVHAPGRAALDPGCAVRKIVCYKLEPASNGGVCKILGNTAGDTQTSSGGR